MMARGIFEEGIHYFRPLGPGSRPIFSWRAVVDFIECNEKHQDEPDTIRLADGSVIDLNDAAKEATRLLR